MKTRLLIILLLLAPAQSWGWMGVHVAGSGVPAEEAPAGCSCTGTTLFCWDAEDTTVTSGTPAGCSAGDAAAAASGAVELSTTAVKYGTYSVHPTSVSDFYVFDVAGDDIVNDAAGRFSVWVYNPSGDATNYIAEIRGSSSNNIYLSWVNNTARIQHTGNGTTQTLNGSSGTIANDAWTFVVFSWSVAGEGVNYLRIGTSSDGSAPSNWEYHTTALTAMTDVPYVLRIGEVGSQGYDHYIDTISISSAW